MLSMVATILKTGGSFSPIRFWLSNFQQLLLLMINVSLTVAKSALTSTPAEHLKLNRSPLWDLFEIKMLLLFERGKKKNWVKLST